MKSIYLDTGATTHLKKEILNEMMPYLTYNYGNASSIYTLGKKSKMAIEDSRIKIAEALNCEKSEIYFTSGATESNNWALKGIALANKTRGTHIITTKIEHPSVLKTCEFLEKQGFEITYLPVDEYGLISLDQLQDAITDKTILISVMFANNEIGTIQPIEEIGEICNKNNIYFHTDAVQALGKVPIYVKKYNIDLLSLSGHKIYAPKGTGILYIKNGINIENLIHGGSQENGMRPGTESVANCVGIGKAISLITKDIESRNKKIRILRDKLINKIHKNIGCAKLNGHPTQRLSNNINFSLRDVNGTMLTLILDVLGICVSSGSACSCKSKKPSHVLLALGLSETLATESIRITLSEEITDSQIDYIFNQLSKVIDEIRINTL
ncbi:cysteine desulfurase family protein [Tepidibacter mesophilus]|uniref:cysteine desulfurase family protein n=1 Tax=Tepidibacter mesophilus TaxID=655607 RepID=UPI000C081342|nr:IscS subfamily cysteine desulfurase [Tepidibacter mesophilus]